MSRKDVSDTDVGYIGYITEIEAITIGFDMLTAIFKL